jgi:beta-lactamase superfamily II metal-dependent hydrolase
MDAPLACGHLRGEHRDEGREQITQLQTLVLSHPDTGAVPTITAVIVVKSLAARTRQKDKEDVHRLLVVADDSGIALLSPPYDNLDIGHAAEYLHGPFLYGASQHLRALVYRVVPRPLERPAFVNL